MRLTISLAKSKLILLHQSNPITTALLGEQSYLTLPIYPDNGWYICLHYKVLLRFIWEIYLAIIRHSLKMFPLSRLSLYAIYIHAYLRCINPRCVLTHIDNCQIYSIVVELSKFDSTSYLAIQNGARHIPCFSKRLAKLGKSAFVFHHDEFFCYGTNDLKVYSKYNHIYKRGYPVGSVASGFYLERRKSDLQKIHTVSYISQWHPEFFDINSTFSTRFTREFVTACRHSIYIILSLLSSYCTSRSFNLSIILRSNTEDEYQFYRNLLPKGTKLLKRLDPFSSYEHGESSCICVALNSTLLTDLLKLRTRVLWFNPHRSDFFERKIAGPLYLETDSVLEASRKLDYVLGLPTQQYNSIVESISPMINNISEHSLPHSKIRARIREVL